VQVAFLGEQGMDSGGVTREWFSALSNAVSHGSPELFCPAGGYEAVLRARLQRDGCRGKL